VTPVEVLTQQAPVSSQESQADPVIPSMVPQPFLDIAQHCLRRDPLQRWTTAQTAGCLNPAPIEVAAPATPEATEEKITPPEGNVGGQQILLGGRVQESLVSPASQLF